MMLATHRAGRSVEVVEPSSGQKASLLGVVVAAAVVGEVVEEIEQPDEDHACKACKRQ